jgi:putative transposase
MTNHVHLLLTPQEADGASLLMKHLGQRYVQYVNRAYRRSGTLWEGRFRSCLAQEEDYVLACYRYIELNPVRAQMVSHPRHYRWSSYRTNAQGKASEFLVPHAQYRALGRSETGRREAYRLLFRGELDPEKVDEIRLATNGNFALGGERFRQQMEAALGRKASRGKPGRPPKPTEEGVPSEDLFG